MSGRKTTLLFLVLQVVVILMMILNIYVSVKSILKVTELGEPFLHLRDTQIFNVGLSSAALLLGGWNAYNLFNRFRGEDRIPEALADAVTENGG